MKRIFTSLFAVFLGLMALAQTTPKFSYQAVVRNSSNELLVNDSVTVMVCFYNHDASSDAVYSERHNVNSNANGLISLMIGDGNVIAGSLSQVVWNDAYVRTEIVMRGGYSVTDVKPVTAVPFAYYAERIPLQALEEHLGSTALVTSDALRDTLSRYATVLALRDSLGTRPTRADLSDTLSRYITAAGLSDTLSRYATVSALRDNLGTRPTRLDLSDTLTRYVTVAGLSDTLSRYATVSALRDSLGTRPTRAGLSDTLSRYVTASGLSDTLSRYATVSSLRDSLGTRPTRADLSDTLTRYVTAAGLSDTLSRYATVSSLRDSLGTRPTRADLSDTLSRYVTAAGLEDYVEEVLSDSLANYVSLSALETSLQSLRDEINAELTAEHSVVEDKTVTSAHVSSNLFALNHVPNPHRQVLMFVNGVLISQDSYSISGDELLYLPANNGGKILEEGDRVQIYYDYK